MHSIGIFCAHYDVLVRYHMGKPHGWHYSSTAWGESARVLYTCLRASLHRVVVVGR